MGDRVSRSYDRDQSRGERSARRSFDVLMNKIISDKSHDISRSVIEQAQTIIGEKYENVDEDFVGLLKKSKVLNLIGESIIDRDPSTCKSILKRIHKNFDVSDENAIINEIRGNLSGCIESKHVKEVIDEKTKSSYRDIDTWIYHELRELKDSLYDMERASESIMKGLRKEREGYDPKYEEDKKYCKCKDDILRLRKLADLIPPNAFSQSSLEKIEKLKDQFETLKEKVWYKDYRKELQLELITHGNKLNVFKEIAEEAQNVNERRKCMECVGSLEKNILAKRERYNYRSEVVLKCEEYQKTIRDLRIEIHRKDLDDVKMEEEKAKDTSERRKCIKGINSLEKNISEDKGRYRSHPEIVSKCEEYLKAIRGLRIEAHGKDLDDVKMEEEKANDVNKREKCVKGINSLEKKIGEDKEHYRSHPEIVSKCEEYLKEIRDLRIEIHGKNLDDVKRKVEKAKGANEGEKYMEDIDYLEKKIDKDRECYYSHPEVVSKCDEHLEGIRDLRLEICMKDFDDVKRKVKEANNANEREKCMEGIVSLEKKMCNIDKEYYDSYFVGPVYNKHLERIRDLRLEICMKDFDDVKNKVGEAKNANEREKEKNLKECQKDILAFKGKIDEEKGRYHRDPEVVLLCLHYQAEIIRFRRDLGLSFE